MGRGRRRAGGRARRGDPTYRATRPARDSRLIRLVERLAIALASLALSIGLIVLLSGYFANRDQAGVSGAGTGPGQTFADLGHGALRRGQPRPQYNSNPPTSGAHVVEAIPGPGAPLNVDQLLQALEVGDVVIVYGSRQPPPGLAQLARSVAPPFTPALAATGDAVILARRPHTAGLVALAWTHLLRVARASDPLLREFVGLWLGRGAPGTH